MSIAKVKQLDKYDEYWRENNSKSKTNWQISIGKNHDIFFKEGHIIHVYERKGLQIPCAWTDIDLLHNELMLHSDNSIIDSIMYDFNCGNVGYVKATYISAYNLIKRDMILHLGLKTDVCLDNWHWFIEWDIKTFEEIADNMRDNYEYIDKK